MRRILEISYARFYVQSFVCNQANSRCFQCFSPPLVISVLQKSHELIGAIVVGMHRVMFERMRKEYPGLVHNNVPRIASTLVDRDAARALLFTHNFLKFVRLFVYPC